MLENAKRLLRPFLVWQFLVFKHNQHEMLDAIRLAKSIGFDAINIAPARVHMGADLFTPLKASWRFLRTVCLSLVALGATIQET